MLATSLFLLQSPCICQLKGPLLPEVTSGLGSLSPACLLSAPVIEAVEQPWLGHFVFGASGLGSYCYFLGISELP